jgi:hypothetical protein
MAQPSLVQDGVNLLLGAAVVHDKRSPLGKVVFDQPYCLLIEAKQDDFTEGWGQCLAEMIAAQRLNPIPEQIIFGIVSNGKNWEFGRLQMNIFTRNQQALTIWNLEDLCAVVNNIFRQCQLQLQNTSILECH